MYQQWCVDARILFSTPFKFWICCVFSSFIFLIDCYEANFINDKTKCLVMKNPGKLHSYSLVITLCKYWQKIETKNMLITNAEGVYKLSVMKPGETLKYMAKKETTLYAITYEEYSNCWNSALNDRKRQFSAVNSTVSQHNLSSYFLSHLLFESRPPLFL